MLELFTHLRFSVGGLALTGYLVLAFIVYWLAGRIRSMQVPPSLQNIAHISPLRSLYTLSKNRELSINLTSMADYLRSLDNPVGCEYGSYDIFLTYIFGEWTVNIANGDLAHYVYTHPDIFEKGTAEEEMPGTLLAQLVDHNIVVSKTHDWRRHRRVVNPAFKRGWNPDVFGECAKSAAERISNTPGMVLNVHPCITAITVDSLTKTAFGQSLGALDGKSVKFVELFQEVLREMFSILPTVMPWLDRPWNPFRRHLHAKVAEIDATFAEIVAVKRNELKRRVLDEKEEIGGSQMDILSLLINACESESAGWPLSVSELAADVRMFYQAGSETTAASITCMLYLLAKNPEIQTKARQHVIDIMGDDAACPIPTAEQVRQLTYLTQVIKETLRVYPSIVFSPPRRTTREVELAGHIIPANTRVAVSTWLVHRNVRHWQYPERFDPDRFSDETNDSISSKNRGWVPFGAGPRACIGMSMSMMEQKVVMSVLLRKFTWTLPPDAPSALKFDPSLMLSPNNCRLQFAHRH